MIGWARRLRAEWDLLQRLAEANPERLVDLQAEDAVFRFRLRGVPAISLSADNEEVVSEHNVRIEFPAFFPAAPLELYLECPMQHPNVHPETGFLCLWQTHRTTYTVEHAVLKTVALLGWQLLNEDAVHVMQPEAMAKVGKITAIRERLHTRPFTAVTQVEPVISEVAAVRRQRLS